MTEVVRAYSHLGWSIIPLLNKRVPHIPWQRYQKERPTDIELIGWWNKWPNAWIGLVLGTVSGIVRVDMDGAIPQEELDRLPSTMEFDTPSGGHGWLYSASIPIKTEVLWRGSTPHNELRIQSDGAYTVLPPSPGYTWCRDEPIRSIPKWLYDRNADRIVSDLAKTLTPWTAIPDRGTIEEALRCLSRERCNDYAGWIQVGIALHSAGDEMLKLWVEWSKGSDKFKEGECERCWASFKKEGRLTSRSLVYWAKLDTPNFRSTSRYEPFTDIANGRVLARHARDSLRYCDEWSRWLEWDGTRWKLGQGQEAQALYKEVIHERYKETCKRFRSVTDIVDEEAQRKRIKQLTLTLHECRKFESARAMHAAVDCAKTEELLRVVDVSVLDRSPMYLNCPNGTLDLTSGELLDHDRTHMLTQCTPTVYDPEAKCPRWMQFLQEVFASDDELIDWMQRLLGYCVTGDVSLHILPVWYGSGRNGKSTIVNTMIRVLGHDYAGTVPSGFLAEQRTEPHPTKLVELYNKRFTVDAETKDRMQLNEELVKRLTGGDQMKARRMYEDFWQFDPTHKLILITNYEPTVVGTDDAIWGRMLKVPFTQSFLGREEPGLDAKLQTESVGILRWLVDGCLAWRAKGLRPYPTVVQTATREYRTEQNVTLRFFQEKLTREASSIIPKSIMIAAYSVWCTQNRVRQASAKTFGKELRRWYGTDFREDPRVYSGVKLV